MHKKRIIYRKNTLNKLTYTVHWSKLGLNVPIWVAKIDIKNSNINVREKNWLNSFEDILMVKTLFRFTFFPHYILHLPRKLLHIQLPTLCTRFANESIPSGTLRFCNIFYHTLYCWMSAIILYLKYLHKYLNVTILIETIRTKIVHLKM